MSNGICKREVKPRHSHGIKLLERGHGLEQQNNHSPSLDGFYCPCEQIRRDGLKILQDQHPISISENLMGFLIISVNQVNSPFGQVAGFYERISYIGDSNKNLKGILFIWFADSSFYIPFDFRLSFLSVGGEAEIFFVTP